MTKLALVGAGLVCALAFAPAAQATDFNVGSPNFFITNGTPFTPTISAEFFNSYGTATSFDDSFLFTIPQNGIGSGSISTSFSSEANKLFIEQLIINGVTYGVISNASGQSATVGNIPIFANTLNTIRVIGYTLGAGGVYAGTATFTAGVIPEPVTWALMVTGFAAVGAAFRRNRRLNVSFS